MPFADGHEQKDYTKTYYETNKAHINNTRLKNQHRHDIGKTVVDELYALHNDDMVKIKPIIAFLRAKIRCEKMAINLGCVHKVP